MHVHETFPMQSIGIHYPLGYGKRIRWNSTGLVVEYYSLTEFTDGVTLTTAFQRL